MTEKNKNIIILILGGLLMASFVAQVVVLGLRVNTLTDKIDDQEANIQQIIRGVDKMNQTLAEHGIECDNCDK